MKFKNGQLFWGFFFLSIGAIFLLDKNDYINFIPHEIINYWPVLIIIWGVAILLKNTIAKPIISIISGIFLALFLYGSFWGYTENSDYSDKYANFSEEFKDSTKNATLKITTGMGKITANGTTEKLISGSFSGINTISNFKTRYDNNDARIVFKQRNDDIHILGKNGNNNVDFSLNPNPIWKIYLTIGAAEVNLDLSEYKVSEFNLETGATDCELKFGNKLDLVNLDVEMGAANLRIFIPRESGCLVKGDMVLVSKEFDDLVKIDKDRFETDNFQNASKKVIINLDGGVSNFEIERY
jgi:hypothetical protein